jgi:plasmid stability protein
MCGETKIAPPDWTLMKNITVSIPDEIYREARVSAARRGTSVSALVRDFL